jgi:hypothetical protein
MLVKIEPFKFCLTERGLDLAAIFVSSVDVVLVLASFWLTQKEINEILKQGYGRIYKEHGP